MTIFILDLESFEEESDRPRSGKGEFSLGYRKVTRWTRVSRRVKRLEDRMRGKTIMTTSM